MSHEKDLTHEPWTNDPGPAQSSKLMARGFFRFFPQGIELVE
jgi:hypothetical protein